MKDRAFGVELEFDSNGLDRQGVARVLRNEFDRRGMRRWYFLDRLDYDGSEIELKTPILRGKKGFETLKIVMNTLADQGCDVSSDDGLHVHHDAPEFIDNIDNCIQLVKSWKKNQHLIYQFVSPDRVFDYYDGNEGSYWACPMWSDEKVKQLELTRKIPGWDRNDLNLAALQEHGSIEIRLHEGTLDYTEAESWIKFGQSFINRVLKHSMRTSKDATNLLKKVRVDPLAERVLINKAAEMRRMRERGYGYH
ncbi:MAG: amidoligase family protein [Nitrososphaerales archaeon]